MLLLEYALFAAIAGTSGAVQQSREPEWVPAIGSGDRESLLASYRLGLSARRERTVAVALPKQVSAVDLDYWVWVLGIGESTAGRLHACLPDLHGEDDRYRLEHFPRLFDLAQACAARGDERNVEEIRSTCRALGREWRASIAGLTELEQRCWESCLLSKVADPSPDELALIEGLALMRSLESNRSPIGSMRPAAIDVYWLVYSLAGSGDLPDAQAPLARQILHDAIAEVAELRKANERAMLRHTEANLVRSWLERKARDGADLPTDMLESARTDLAVARRQFAIANRRLAEAQESLVESLGVGLEAPGGEAIRAAYINQVYRGAATSPWNCIELATRIVTELARSGPEAVAEEGRSLLAEYIETLQGADAEVYRILKRHWQRTRDQGGLAPSWVQAAQDEIRRINATQQVRSEQLLAVLLASLPEASQAEWRDTAEAFRRSAQARIAEQLEAIIEGTRLQRPAADPAHAGGGL